MQSEPSNVGASEEELAHAKQAKLQQSATAREGVLSGHMHDLSSVKAESATKEDLLHTSAKLEAIVPDGYQSWRVQADFLVAAITQLETRQIEADGSVKVIGVPLLEDELRDAAETALRNCAHFAQTVEERTALIDEANRVRRTSWF